MVSVIGGVTLSHREYNISKGREKTTMVEICEEIGWLMEGLDFGEILIETIILNSSNKKATGFLQAVVLKFRRDWLNLSDVLFEITTYTADRSLFREA